MLYGRDGTWHQTKEINVELDINGNVVSVWFRCMALPFTQTTVGDSRAEEMKRMYATGRINEVIAVEVKEK
jgi:hypothetical protein